MTARTAARLAAVLLVVTAGLFVLGITEENGDQHTESTEATHTEGEAAHEDESGEAAERADEAQSEASGFTENRKILGLDPESPGLVAVGGVLSAALAAGLWLINKRGIAVAAAAFAAMFAAALDATEVSHQLDENRNSLAALAVAVAVGHAIAALAAGRAALRPDTTQEVS